ncbi:type IV secretory system conjugative DNA transfer family protein [Pseudophaeobacter sp.]|uniref:type IV secretory system conjugative DNA transfer family protein n=1 Tax=Pseudophaeobacter sp. TaxID=1971739 RepID=UPI00329781AD
MIHGSRSLPCKVWACLSAIIPNLLMYQGSVLVIDPKGENARLTAERRGQGRGVSDGGLGQDVFVIDPFGVSGVGEAYRAGFNPLAALNPHSDDFIDDCDAIADALVAQEGQGDNSYFYDAARLVLRGFIAWVVAHPEIQDKSLTEVKRLLFLPRYYGEQAAGPVHMAGWRLWPRY